MNGFDIYGYESKPKRTLGIRDKQILWNRAGKVCENPGCPSKDRKLEFDEMQVGHKKAYSKGGKTNLNNSVCLCYRCNKLQGTDSWETFLKKQGLKVEGKPDNKEFLQELTLAELKSLTSKLRIRVKGTTDDWGNPIAPAKPQYIKALAKEGRSKDDLLKLLDSTTENAPTQEKEIKQEPTQTPPKKKKPKRRREPENSFGIFNPLAGLNRINKLKDDSERNLFG